MAKVLVAGGAGFIGSHLCASLLHEGYQIVCVDNFITSDEKNVTLLKNDRNFSFIRADIINDDLRLQLSDITHIFHLASPASPNKKSPRSYVNYPIETLLVNSQGTYKLLELAKQNNASLLYVSSSEIYGDPAISPQPETYFGNVNPNGIRSVYDEAKRFGEAITMGYVRKYSLDARIVRIFNTYGPKMQVDDGRVISNFINQALRNEAITIYGTGDQTRSFCYVDDMIEGLKKALFTHGTKGEVFNMGNPDERSIKAIAALIKEMTNASSEITFEALPQDDPKIRKPDITKAQEKLSWQPKVTLEDGLTKTVEYFKSL